MHACTWYVCVYVLLHSPDRAACSISLKGECCSFWEIQPICWMLPLATPCPTHYRLIKGSKICLLRNIQQLAVHFCVYVYAHVQGFAESLQHPSAVLEVPAVFG